MHDKCLVLEYEIDAPPEKVWRAISIPAFREGWLPNEELLEGNPLSTRLNEEISYRMRDRAPPFLESVVVFQVRPDTNGGTVLRIVQKIADSCQSQCMPLAANSNAQSRMMAA